MIEGALVNRKKFLKWLDNIASQPARPAHVPLKLYSARGRKVENADRELICRECLVAREPLYSFDDTSIGPVHLCARCKSKPSLHDARPQEAFALVVRHRMRNQ